MKSSLPSSFTYLNITQFLGALNDNIFKLLIVFFLINLQGLDKSSAILAKAGAVFVIPFLLFSTTAGKFADRFSKRNIIVFSKAMEVAVMAFGIIAFALHNAETAYITLFLMATQSAIFSPSKYGIIPELVEHEKISQANGLLTTFTFLAIIIGTFLASFATDISKKNFVFSASLCTAIALLGLFTSLHIKYTPPVGKKKRITPFFLYEVYKTLQRSRNHNRLFCAILGSAFFLFLGSYLQLNIIPFSIQSLKLSEVQGGYLFLITALGIGLGSFLSGRASGNHVELGLTPIAGLGITISCFLLYLFENSIYCIIPLIVITGIFGGIWIVPFDSFIQTSSPKNFRGEMLATTNFLSFIGVLCSSGLLYFLSDTLHLKASQGFFIISLLTLTATLIVTITTLDYFLRFISSIFSSLFFRLSVSGSENIPPKIPSLIICNYSSFWINTIILTSIQNPPLHFFIESEKSQKKWLKKLCSIIRVSLISPQRNLKHRKRVYDTIKSNLDKGVTVCIFAKLHKDDSDIISAYLSEFQSFLLNTPYSAIPVHIEEENSHPKSGKFLDKLKKFPWPVNISFGLK